MYVFVDLRGRAASRTALPIAYIVPSAAVKAYCEPWAHKVALVRYQPAVAMVKQYREAWAIFDNVLRK